MKKLLKILLVLVISLPVIVFGTADNNPVSALISGDYAYELIDDNSVTIINYGGDEKNLTIPSKIDGKTVKKIGYGAFAECKSIETLVIPETIITIGDYAFSQCSQLSKITIPDSVVALGQYSLAGCSSLTSVEIPNGISAIPYATFFDCTNLTDVVIPEGIKTIGGMVFGNCRALADINFPTTLTSIGGNAFLNCTGLKSITVSEGVTSLGSGTFQGCLNLVEINLPNTLAVIGQSAFQDCISLESIVLPESVTGIGYAAFTGCSSLTDVNIPSQVDSIRNATFSGCASLEEINIPSTITSLGENVFSGCVSLKSVVIPDSVTEIGASTFSNCSNLKEVTLPKNLDRISASLFRYCDSIETVVIPNGVVAVDDTAFADCMNLKSVTFPNTIKASENDGNGIGSRIFSHSPKVVASVIEGSVAHTYMRRNGYNFTLITTGINLDKPELTLDVNESSKYVAILSPYKVVDNTSLSWQSNNPGIASVDANGVVTGITEGKATIIVKGSNGLSASSEVTVTNINAPITNVSLNRSDLEIKKDSSSPLRATVTPKETTDDKTLTWESNNPEVATVSSTGVVTARKPGNAIITVRTSNGLTDTCNVTVISQITSIHLNLTAITLDEGVSQTLRATINPSDTTDDKTLTWKSNNPEVATVDQEGKVTAIKEGSATITVTTVNGKEATCTVTVLNATALEDAIDRAETIDGSTYTADSYSALQTAIANGKAVLESATATQDDIDLAVEAIETAIDNLVEKASQDLLATLTAKLEECKAMEGNYTSEEFAELKAIIAEVEVVLKTDPNNIATTDALAALEKLTEASDALYLSSALKELGITIDEAKEILNGDLSGYTEASVTALRNALQTAEDLINAGSKDIELIKQANEDLKAAIDNLKEITTDVNKASLKSAIALGDRMIENINNYRPATVEGFEELLQRAKDVNNSATATQNEINKITEELIIAILNARLDPSK